jgi:periplasmic copper chaperone A
MRTVLSRVGIFTVTAVGSLLIGIPASAHITVNPTEAPKESSAKLAFRVPNEKDNAATTKLEIVFDEKNPIPVVSVKPLTGWTTDVTTRKLAKPIKTHDEESTEAVEKITWTAQPGAEIAPGQFQEFEISAGPLPNVDELVFKALQTYSDGDVVRWIDESEDAENPAPVLKLTKAEPDHHGRASEHHESADEEDSDSGRALGITGIVIGILGVLLGSFALLRSRRSS